MNSLLIKSICIENYGSFRSYSVEFSEDLQIISEKESDTVLSAVGILTENQFLLDNLPVFRVNDKTRLSASIAIGEDLYFVEALSQAENSKLQLSVYKSEHSDDSYYEYHRLIHCSYEEMRTSCFINPIRQNYQYRLHDYKRHFSDEGFNSINRGICNTQMFRTRTNRFIQNFVPERLREDKELYIHLEKNGDFTVKKSDSLSGEIYPLSESENMVFNYLCFLNLVRFWSQIAEIQNMNGVQPPIIIANFINRLDESVNTELLIKSVQDFGRQVIIVK